MRRRRRVAATTPTARPPVASKAIEVGSGTTAAFTVSVSPLLNVAFIMPFSGFIPLEGRVTFSNVILPEIVVPETYEGSIKKPVPWNPNAFPAGMETLSALSKLLLVPKAVGATVHGLPPAEELFAFVATPFWKSATPLLGLITLLLAEPTVIKDMPVRSIEPV